MPIPVEAQNKAKEIIMAGLRAQDHGNVQFIAIRAEPMLDQYDEEFLNVSVIYEGRREDLKHRLLGSLNRQIKDKLLAAGIGHVPSVSYIDKTEDSEWSQPAAADPPDRQAGMNGLGRPHHHRPTAYHTTPAQYSTNGMRHSAHRDSE